MNQFNQPPKSRNEEKDVYAEYKAALEELKDLERNAVYFETKRPKSLQIVLSSI